jgi:hypothetical protein
MRLYRPERVNFAQYFTRAPKPCVIRVRTAFFNAPAKGETGQLLKLTPSMHYFFPAVRFNACYSVGIHID